MEERGEDVRMKLRQEVGRIGPHVIEFAHWKPCLIPDWISIYHISYGRYYSAPFFSSPTLITKVYLQSKVVRSSDTRGLAASHPGPHSLASRSTITSTIS